MTPGYLKRGRKWGGVRGKGVQVGRRSSQDGAWVGSMGVDSMTVWGMCKSKIVNRP